MGSLASTLTALESRETPEQIAGGFVRLLTYAGCTSPDPDTMYTLGTVIHILDSRDPRCRRLERMLAHCLWSWQDGSDSNVPLKAFINGVVRLIQ
jgi:hypothetical protein